MFLCLAPSAAACPGWAAHLRTKPESARNDVCTETSWDAGPPASGYSTTSSRELGPIVGSPWSTDTTLPAMERMWAHSRTSGLCRLAVRTPDKPGQQCARQPSLRSSPHRCPLRLKTRMQGPGPARGTSRDPEIRVRQAQKALRRAAEERSARPPSAVSRDACNRLHRGAVGPCLTEV